MPTTSTKSKVPWAVARRVAGELMRELGTACERLAVAGSIRRREVLVGDIELLAIPMFKPDLLGEPGESLLLPRIEDMKRRGRFVETIRSGERWKTFAMLLAGDVRLLLDLFVVAPDEWGVAMLLRTGPAAFSRRSVIPAVSGGLLKPGLSVAEHRVWRGRAFATFTLQPRSDHDFEWLQTVVHEAAHFLAFNPILLVEGMAAKLRESERFETLAPHVDLQTYVGAIQQAGQHPLDAHREARLRAMNERTKHKAAAPGEPEAVKPWSEHGATWIRAALHLFHRARRHGVYCSPEGVAGSRYDLYSGRRYDLALGAELLTHEETSVRVILEGIEPPREFVELWEHDSGEPFPAPLGWSKLVKLPGET